MRLSSSRLAQCFAAVGHFYVHLFTAFYYVMVLALEAEWGLGYDELIQLWTLGSFLMGAGALPAGWLADRLGARTMMAVFFFGMGGASVYCGLVRSALELTVGLSAIGLFAAIYHPVGISWLVRNAAQTGKALGFNGIFGSVGVSGAGLITGALIDLAGWRWAFIVPGAASILSGVVFVVCARAGLIAEGSTEGRKTRPASRREMLRGFLVLVLAMLCSGLIFQVLQAGLPKLFEQRLGDLLGGGTAGVGAAVAAVFAVAGIVQYAGGHLADRYPPKLIYVGAYLVQVPLVYVMATLGGLPLIAVAALVVTVGVGLLPAENIMLTRFTPERHRGLAFGLKYVVAFGTAPLALQLLAWLAGTPGGFHTVFVALALLAALVFGMALLLPGERPAPTAVPAE